MQDTKATKEQQIFTIINQYVKDISFENYLTPEKILAGEINPEGNIQISIHANPVEEKSSGNIFEVSIILKLEAKEQKKEKTLYIAEVEYGAIVSMQPCEDQDREAMLMVEVPKLLFPFLRSVISNLTREAGFVPVLLEPIDFFHLWVANTNKNNDRDNT